jgi:hypothetical protein
MFYNPLDQPITRQIRLPLYYTGLKDKATVRRADGKSEKVTLARDYSATVEVNIPARGRTWMSIR